MNLSKYVLVLTLLVCLVLPASAVTWDTPIPIAAKKSGFSYNKPEVKFASSGAVYIAYRERYPDRNSDITMCRYDGKEMTYFNVSEAGKLWPTYECYEPAVETTEDGRVHVAWVSLDISHPAHQYINYRNYDPSTKTWSSIVTMAEAHLHEDDFIFDLRLGVSNNGNVHVIYMFDEARNTFYVAKYGDVITPLEQFQGNKCKHPDIAVNDDVIHILYQEKVGWPYVIMYQRRENRLGGTVEPAFQATYPNVAKEYASQKARMAIDGSGLAHFLDFHKHGPTNTRELLYYEQYPDGTFANDVRISDPTSLKGYHWAAFSIRNENYLATVQIGQTNENKGGISLHYNWKKNGQWLGYGRIVNHSGVRHQSSDLSYDGEIAACSYIVKEESIWLTATGEISATGTLEAAFSNNNNIFAGDTVNFDASQSVNLNPDTTIVSYGWDFGDGATTTTTTPTTTHVYNTYGNDVTVTLTITSADGGTGIISKTFSIKALYTAIIDAVNSSNIRTLFYNKTANEVLWHANPKNVASGFPTISKFEIWRAEQSSTMSNASYSFVGEVDASNTRFLDYKGLKAGTSYVYSIRSVDVEGHKSPISNF